MERILEVINCEGPEDGNQPEWWGYDVFWGVEGDDGRIGNLNSCNDNEPINNDALRHNTIMNFGEFPFPLETCLVSASSYFGYEKP